MGQFDAEVGAGLWSAQQVDAAAMGRNVFLHDGQADAGAVHARRSGWRSPRKKGSKMRSRSAGATPGPASLMSMRARPGVARQRERMVPPRRREADRIGQQVGHRGAQLVRVDRHHQRLALGLAPCRPLRLPLQALRLDLLLQQRQQVGALAAQLARLEGGGVEAQQRLDLVLQRDRVLLQDLRDLALAPG